MIVNNYNEFLGTVERVILRAKDKGNDHTGFFEVKFSENSMPYNAKKYFQEKGYSVELRECKHCASFDIIFSWMNNEFKND